MLRLSLVRALYKDETSRRITNLDMGPLFGDAAEEDDIASGTIYVLRSQSSHPFVAESTAADSQNWRDRRQGRNPHCQCRKRRHLLIG